MVRKKGHHETVAYQTSGTFLDARQDIGQVLGALASRFPILQHRSFKKIETDLLWQRIGTGLLEV